MAANSGRARSSSRAWARLPAWTASASRAMWAPSTKVLRGIHFLDSGGLAGADGVMGGDFRKRTWLKPDITTAREHYLGTPGWGELAENLNHQSLSGWIE